MMTRVLIFTTVVNKFREQQQKLIHITRKKPQKFEVIGYFLSPREHLTCILILVPKSQHQDLFGVSMPIFTRIMQLECKYKYRNKMRLGQTGPR